MRFPKFLILSFIIAISFGCEKKDKNMNPFLEDYKTPYNIPPFEKIRFEHYEKAFEEGMKRHLSEIDKIISNLAEPSFENTIVELERTGKLLQKVTSVFFNLLGSNTNDQMDELASKISPILSSHYDQISLNKDLFKRIQKIYQEREELNLSKEQMRLLTETYKRYVRSGALLDKNSMNELMEINKRLSSLSIKFDQNVLKETNEGYSLIVNSEQDLEGLPEDVIKQAYNLALEEGLENKWVFKPTRVSMYPFLTYSKNRDLREKLYKSYILRGDNNNDKDNKEIVKEMVNLRIKKANLFGYQNYADYVLEDTMAKSRERVNDLLNKVWKPGLNRAKQEIKEMQAMIQSEGQNFQLEAWDWWFYSEKIKKEKYDFSEEETKPYFSEENVLKGAFEVAEKLFKIKFKERKDLPKFRENIKTFEVLDDQEETIGIFYTDYTVRPNKGGGAWMNSFNSQSNFDGKQIPIVANTCNFPPPNEQGISLLSFEQVETLFHEFGHALHGLLSDVEYPSLSGTRVSRDFVELPSQLMENWGRHPDVIRSYAKHYQTGETIPEELLNKISASSKFNQGFATTEYVAASYLDMYWHSISEEIENTNEFEDYALNSIGLISEIESRYRSTYFGHIFAGGYASGYYSYLWTEVLEADAFEAFKENGIYHKKTAEKLKKYIYSTGNSDDLMTQYIRFRGSEPQIDPLLEKRGLK
tara:strand:- start:15640 stop:17742 length:2103 start_codon:yes stop_codon:yes gene_type:complete